MAELQDLAHGAGHDYETGCGHLTHARLRHWITDTLRALVEEQFALHDEVRVLEVGAGHGAFTDHLLAAGADVTVTEMSTASAELLSARYRNNPYARVLHDPDGREAIRAGDTYHLICCASVLHHIPDYTAAVRDWVRLIEPNGSFASFADPLWHPRRGRLRVYADRGSYLAWRALRGDRVEGVRGLVRRARGKHDEANPRDMVEYHVVRQGVDEQALQEALAPDFATVQLLPYWSTPARTLQAVGEKLSLTSDFGLLARGRHGQGGS